MKLPEKYIEKISILLGDEAEAYFKELERDSYNAIRINNKKIPVSYLVKFLGNEFFEKNLNISRIPWIKNGFYIDEVSDASSHPYYRAGLYYIQDPSAMTPAENLPINADDFVLDMCAAPGGKASQLASGLSKDGFLLANDISAGRCRILVKNLEMAGIDNACVTAEDPQKLVKYYKGFFDKILLDAPCSGEGMFRKQPSMAKVWEEKQPEDYNELQYSLLECASQMLKPGGMLMYSTCTFSTIEDEENILRFLNDHPEFKTVSLRHFAGFQKGVKCVDDAVRLYPHKLKGEGHFVCLLQKDENLADENDVESSKETAAAENKQKKKKNDIKTVKKENLPECVTDFLKNVKYDFDSGRFYCDEDRVFYLHKNVSVIKNLRYYRTGLLLGNITKGRFEPAQAFAMALNSFEYTDIVDLPSDSIYVMKYLKGESFNISDEIESELGIKMNKNPWRLICTDGYPLGWAKLSGAVLKNKYEPSWRIN